MNDKNAGNNFLRGGGEMGELIRAKDWSKTSLGNPVTWPQSLRITLNILLNSKFPMFLWWGSDLICFYNDAYRPSLGIDGKHPSILGMPAEKAWPEIWTIVKPLIDQVMYKGESVWFEDMLVPIYRNGKIEDVYWTFSYSPVPGHEDEVAGVLVTCTETTEKVFSLKKIAESDQRFRSTMKQAPVGITILRGPQYIVEMANHAYLQIVDRKESEFVGHPLFNSLPEVEESVHVLLDNVLYTGVPYHGTEVPIPLNRHGKQEVFYFDFLYHPLKEEDGKISGVIVAVTEVTEKVESRSKIEESKRIYETITQNTPDLIYVFDLQYRFRYANEALLKMWGRSWDDSAGKTLLEVGYEPWHAEMHEREIDEVIATKKPIRGEVSFPHANLGKRIYDYIFVPVIDKEGRVEAIAGTTRDITQQIEARNKIEESDEKLRSLIKNAPFPIGVYAGKEMRIEVANESIIKAWGKGNTVNGKLFSEVLPELASQQIFEQLEDVFTSGIPFHAYNQYLNIVVDGREQPYYYNYSFTPLFDSSGNVYGVMNTASDVTNLNLAKKRIEESEQDLRSMALQAPIGICILDASSLVCEIVNERFIEIAGKPREAIAGKYYWDAFAEAKPYYESSLDKVVSEGITFYANEVGLMLIRHGQEEMMYVTFVYAPLKDEEGNVKKVAIWVLDNTQQVMARRKIEEDTQKLNIVIDASELGTWELNLKNNEAKYSKRYLEILGGYTEDIVMNHAQLVQHLHPDDLPVREKALKEAFATGYLHYEARVIWNDQSIHWMEGKGKVFYEEENIPVRILGTIRDITEEKMHEQELTERESKFRLLADSLPQHIWTSDTAGNFTYFNKSVFAYSGLTLEQLNTDGLLQIIHPDDREQHLKQWIASISTGKEFLFEHRFRRYDGQYRWQLSRAIPQRDANGKIQMWVGTSTDIQEQKTFTKELEEKVLARTAELKASEEKFYNLFNLSPISKTLTDAQTGKIIMVNDAFTNIFGYSRDEILYKSSAELGLLDATWNENLIHELKTNGKIKNIEIEFNKKSGEKFFALTSSEIINIGDKQYFLGAYNDISDRKKAEINIEQKNIELERMNKELQAFAYISSHDLQEPLRKIQTFASRIAAKEERNLSGHGKEMFNRMQHAAQRMQTLIQDLLAYSRTSTQEKIFETTDLNGIIAEVKEDLKEELKEKHAVIEANQLCDADIIPFQFRQLMLNLIANSLKFSKPGDPPIIQIKSEMISGLHLHDQKFSSQNMYCHITVADNGIGFEQQYSEKIFEVFQRLHGKDEYKGTGIGLSIVKKIVDNHQGIIKAYGEPDKGATFEIYIPAR